MRYTTFRYNAETCQYERVRVTVKSVIWYCLGLTTVAACMLAGILLLHDLVVNTDRENSLRKENRAFRKHLAILTAQLDDLQPVLASLQHRDEILHEKFFGSQPILPAQEVDHASKQDMLLAEPETFRDHVSSLSNTSNSLIKRSASANYHFASKLALKKDALADLHALPTVQPVQPWKADLLISGFGMRVNPFHKGLYEHLGVDIAMPRGTPVLATAAGTVVQVKKSDLQAGYGNYIEIDHGNGVVTRYAHLEEILVRYGVKVKRGETIGTVGSSGGSVAPHVHYEILRDGKNVDPVYYMVQGMTPAQHYLLTVNSHKQNQSLD